MYTANNIASKHSLCVFTALIWESCTYTTFITSLCQEGTTWVVKQAIFQLILNE